MDIEAYIRIRLELFQPPELAYNLPESLMLVVVCSSVQGYTHICTVLR